MMKVDPRMFWQAGVLLALGLCIPLAGNQFASSIALTCLLYITLATSWSLFSGTSKYLSLATSAFFGTGVYVCAILIASLPWPLLIAGGALAAALLALVMGAAVLHLRGTYFAVLTFGMTELLRHAVTYAEKQSGTAGRLIQPAPEFETVYYTVLILAVLAVLTGLIIQRSWLGLALFGVGSDEQRSETLGVNTRVVKLIGFAITAAFAGAAGAAMAGRWTYIDPATAFNPLIGFQTVLIVMIGGAGTILGPLVAAVVFSVIAETLRLQLPYLYMAILGGLLVLSVLYMPNGLSSLWNRKGRGT